MSDIINKTSNDWIVRYNWQTYQKSQTRVTDVIETVPYILNKSDTSSTKRPDVIGTVPDVINERVTRHQKECQASLTRVPDVTDKSVSTKSKCSFRQLFLYKQT